LRLNHSK